MITDALRTSLWFLPMMMLSASLVMVLGAQFVDGMLLRRGREASPYIYVSDPENAREVLATLLSSMITMTSLVFSITMVVLTLAANQFGPRLIRNFMALPLTQLALGTFVMTSGYCLLSLALIGSRSSGVQQPFASVSLAVLLAFASIVVLVVFLHTLARSIVSETVIRRVGSEIDDFIEELEELEAGPIQETPEFEAPAGDAVRFGPKADGYVQAIRFDELVEVATAARASVHFSFRPGDYVVAGGTGILVSPAAHCSAELRSAALSAVVIGSHRTPTQDPEFSIRHLVEIAVRALSPGINDPYTASAVVDQLSGCLSRLVVRRLPVFVASDSEGVRRVVCQSASYSSLIGAAFNQIRQSAGGKPMVLIHLIEAIARIADHTTLDAPRQALREQLEAIIASLDNAPLPALDKRAVHSRADAAFVLLSDDDQ